MTDWRARLEALDEMAPSDEVLRRARRGPSRPEPNEGPHRGTRIAAAVTAFAVFALAGGFAFQVLRSTEPHPATSSVSPTGPALEATQTYTDPLGWSVDYPSAWVATPFDVTSRVTSTGVRISNVPIPSAAPNSATPVPEPFPDAATVPAGATFIIINHTEGGPYVLNTDDDSSFPLSADDLEGIPGDLPYQSIDVRANGLSYEVLVWTDVGPDAPPAADMEAMRRLIASIRFPAIPQSGVVRGWASIGPPLRHFPARTGTPWSVTRLSDVYVMHGPEGTYALDLEPSDCRDEGFEGISEEWDADHLLVVLRCANGSVERWDRYGTPVPGNDPWFRTTLAVHPVITAWNGDLLVNVDATVGGLAEQDWP